MHKPVLLEETINYLNLRENKIYVDCTLGLGGHSLEILKRTNSNIKLIAIDRDEEALKIAKENLKDFKKNCFFFNANYTDLKEVLNQLGILKIDGGILLDLGVSSLQLDEDNRGFSFRNEAGLDMRMDQSQELTAYKVINSYKEEELANIIFNYGEERYSRRIARLIVEQRKKLGPVKNTTELVEIVAKCYPRGKRFKIHPATKTFQALRIEVNKELENLENFLCFIPELLLAGSRLTIISFHSLEDRITKFFLKNRQDFRILTKKPVVPSPEEFKDNPRARSAKLRAAEKL